MNLYEYQRSRSFINLGPRSLRFTFSNFFSLETAMPIEAKFHVEPSCLYMVKTLKKSSSLEPNN